MKVGLSANQALWGKEFAIKRKRSSAHQIVAVLKQAKPGMKVADATHQMGVSKQTFRRLLLSAKSVILDSPAVNGRANEEFGRFQRSRCRVFDEKVEVRAFVIWT